MYPLFIEKFPATSKVHPAYWVLLDQSNRTLGVEHFIYLGFACLFSKFMVLKLPL